MPEANSASTLLSHAAMKVLQETELLILYSAAAAGAVEELGIESLAPAATGLDPEVAERVSWPPEEASHGEAQPCDDWMDCLLEGSPLLSSG